MATILRGKLLMENRLHTNLSSLLLCQLCVHIATQCIAVVSERRPALQTVRTLTPTNLRSASGAAHGVRCKVEIVRNKLLMDNRLHTNWSSILLSQLCVRIATQCIAVSLQEPLAHIYKRR